MASRLNVVLGTGELGRVNLAEDVAVRYLSYGTRGVSPVEPAFCSELARSLIDALVHKMASRGLHKMASRLNLVLGAVELGRANLSEDVAVRYLIIRDDAG